MCLEIESRNKKQYENSFPYAQDKSICYFTLSLNSRLTILYTKLVILIPKYHGQKITMTAFPNVSLIAQKLPPTTHCLLLDTSSRSPTWAMYGTLIRVMIHQVYSWFSNLCYADPAHLFLLIDKSSRCSSRSFVKPRTKNASILHEANAVLQVWHKSPLWYNFNYCNRSQFHW